MRRSCLTPRLRPCAPLPPNPRPGWLSLQVSTVGIRAANMRNSMEKKRQPVLLKTLMASLPMCR